MTTDQMRSALVESYPGPRWKRRVQEMPEMQVLAAYKRLERQGELRKHDRYSSGKPRHPGAKGWTSKPVYTDDSDEDHDF